MSWFSDAQAPEGITDDAYLVEGIAIESINCLPPPSGACEIALGFLSVTDQIVEGTEGLLNRGNERNKGRDIVKVRRPSTLAWEVKSGLDPNGVLRVARNLGNSW